MPKVLRNEQNLSECSCPNCPSYNECAQGKKETLYCNEKSSCPYKMNGCICRSCAVHQRLNLNNGYYCTRGSSDQID